MTTNNDSSNNIYFHDILETTIQDISNNPRMSFINYITNCKKWKELSIMSKEIKNIVKTEKSLM